MAGWMVRPPPAATVEVATMAPLALFVALDQAVTRLAGPGIAGAPLLALAAVATGGLLYLAAGDGAASVRSRQAIGLAIGCLGALGLARGLALVSSLLVADPWPR